MKFLNHAYLKKQFRAVCIATGALALLQQSPAVATPLDDGWRNPPRKATAWVYWMWLQTPTTTAAMTRDKSKLVADRFKVVLDIAHIRDPEAMKGSDVYYSGAAQDNLQAAPLILCAVPANRFRAAWAYGWTQTEDALLAAFGKV